jgi:hypothetical protein
MVKKMKVKINNLDVECSVEEFKEILNLREKKINLPEPVKRKIVYNTYKRKGWTKTEDKVILIHGKNNINESIRLLPHRNRGAILGRLYRLNYGVKGRRAYFTSDEENIIKENHQKGIKYLKKLLPQHKKGRRLYDKVYLMKKRGEL